MAESSTKDQPTGSGRVPGGAPDEGSRQFGLGLLYVKDMSFEAPNSPTMFKDRDLEPEIKLNLKTTHRDLGNATTEVVLHLSVHALAGQRTMFLVELQQAGTFLIKGFTPEEVKSIIGTSCPNTLFPYAREAISSIIQRGGFAQVLLQPMDFTALYAQAKAKAGSATVNSAAGTA